MTGTAARPAQTAAGHAARPRRGAGLAPGRAPARPAGTCRPRPAAPLPPELLPHGGGCSAAPRRQKQRVRPALPLSATAAAPPAGRDGGSEGGMEGKGEREREGGRRRCCPAPLRSRPAAVPAPHALSPGPPPLSPAAGQLRAARPSPASPGLCSYSGGSPRGFLWLAFYFFGRSLPWPGPAGERDVLRGGESVRFQRAWEENLAKICTEPRQIWNGP